MAIVLESPGPVLLPLGIFAIRWWGVCLSIGILMAAFLTRRLALRQEQDPELILDLVWWLFLGAAPTSRLVYILLDWQRFAIAPWWEIFSIWRGGFSLGGALLGGILALWLFTRRRGLPFLTWVDLTVPGTLWVQVVSSWGHFFNNEAYGRAMDPGHPLLLQLRLPDGSLVHPLFLYEFLWNLGVCTILLPLAWRKPLLKPGTLTLTYAIGYCLGRYWIEGLQARPWIWGAWHVGQNLSLVVVVVAVLWLWWLYGLEESDLGDPVGVTPALVTLLTTGSDPTPGTPPDHPLTGAEVFKTSDPGEPGIHSKIENPVLETPPTAGSDQAEHHPDP